MSHPDSPAIWPTFSPAQGQFHDLAAPLSGIRFLQPSGGLAGLTVERDSATAD